MNNTFSFSEMTMSSLFIKHIYIFLKKNFTFWETFVIVFKANMHLDPESHPTLSAILSTITLPKKKAPERASRTPKLPFKRTLEVI